MVKFELGKKDCVWIGLVVVLVCIGFGYAYGGSSPSIMGHSGSELTVNNVLCRAITGHNCGYDTDTNTDTNTNAVTICANNKFLDGDGQCRTTTQIITDSRTSQIITSGSTSNYGSLTVNGKKNSYAGINFKSGSTNYGTLMVHPEYQGFYNNGDNGWDWYFQNGVMKIGVIPWARISGAPSYTDTNAITKCGTYEYLRGDGSCVTAAQITSSFSISTSLTNCYWTPYSCGAYECSSGYVVVGQDAKAHNEDCYGSGDWDSESRRLKCCKLTIS
ncbi:hypothetical protein HNV12_03420 [Methanococcoides sp. SA1]|nr:hypothetical protein [Methanococcoides sp. SA1]